MEKLIELLNEYEKLNMCRKFDNFAMHTFEDSSGVDSMLEDTVISRRYGFIKWLVDNDKIDRTDLGKREMMLSCTKYENLLMWLSIQDNPIEFLISILR